MWAIEFAGKDLAGALHESNWVLGSPRGTAIRLGLKRTTLQSRTQKLGIAPSTT